MPTHILLVEVGLGWDGIVRFRKYFHSTRESCIHAVPTTAFSAQSKRCIVGYTYRVYYHCNYHIILLPLLPPSLPSQAKGTAVANTRNSALSLLNCIPALVQHLPSLVSFPFTGLASSCANRGRGLDIRVGIFYDIFLHLQQFPIDANSLPIQAKVSAVLHVKNILCYVT